MNIIHEEGFPVQRTHWSQIRRTKLQRLEKLKTQRLDSSIIDFRFTLIFFDYPK